LVDISNAERSAGVNNVDANRGSGWEGSQRASSVVKVDKFSGLGKDCNIRLSVTVKVSAFDIITEERSGGSSIQNGRIGEGESVHITHDPNLTLIGSKACIGISGRNNEFRQVVSIEVAVVEHQSPGQQVFVERGWGSSG